MNWGLTFFYGPNQTIFFERTFLARNNIEMNSFYLVMIQTSNSSPEGILGDELGTNLIYETKFCLRGRFWLGIKLRCQVFYLGIIQTPNSFSEQFPGDELGTNLIYRPNQTRICWSRPFCLGMKLKCLVSNFTTCYILKLHICPMIRDVIGLMLVGEMHIGPQASKRVDTY